MGFCIFPTYERVTFFCRCFRCCCCAAGYDHLFFTVEGYCYVFCVVDDVECNDVVVVACACLRSTGTVDCFGCNCASDCDGVFATNCRCTGDCACCFLRPHFFARSSLVESIGASGAVAVPPDTITCSSPSKDTVTYSVLSMMLSVMT